MIRDPQYNLWTIHWYLNFNFNGSQDVLRAIVWPLTRVQLYVHDHCILLWIDSLRVYSQCSARKNYKLSLQSSTTNRPNWNVVTYLVKYLTQLGYTYDLVQKQVYFQKQKNFLLNWENKGCSICKIVDYWEANWYFSESGLPPKQ